jgi:hypothetical protein
MKKVCLFVIFLLMLSRVQGQWTTDASGTHTVNNVGIGISPSSSAKLHISGQLRAYTQFHMGENHDPVNGRGITIDHTASTSWEFLTLKNTNGTHFRVLGNGNTTLSGDISFSQTGRKIGFNNGTNRAEIELYNPTNGNINISNVWTGGNADIFIRPDRNVHIRHADDLTTGLFILQSSASSYETTNNKIVFAGTENGTTANPYGLRKDIQWVVGQEAGQHFTFRHGTAETEFLRISSNGNVGIGTPNPGSFKLAVNGKIWSQEVNVAMTNPGPDYVFEKDYNLLPLSELETYISQNKHLPEVPSAKEMEAEGLNLKEMNLILLKKVEELTLHLIAKDKQVEHLQIQNKKIEERLKIIENQ